MIAIVVLTATIALLAVVIYSRIPLYIDGGESVPDHVVYPMEMQLTSPAFVDGGPIPIQYTCQGKDVNPPLSISNPPKGTESFVLIVEDPDAPAGDWTHWMVWNMPKDTIEIDPGILPPLSVEGTTDFGKLGYGGPCPPEGEEHNYHFELIALDTTLDTDCEVGKGELRRKIRTNILDKALLIGKYKKQ